jgi:hypothetical protein
MRVLVLCDEFDAFVFSLSLGVYVVSHMLEVLKRRLLFFLCVRAAWNVA